MNRFHTRRRVPFNPHQMFDLVAQVEDYPKFLPWCECLQVKSRANRGKAEVLIADMTVAYKLVRETFTSRVTLEPDIPRVLVQYLEGPFRHLENRWLFHVCPDGCDVDFYIAYEFRSMMLQILLGTMFDQAVRKFVEAFETRAHLVYGRPNNELTHA